MRSVTIVGAGPAGLTAARIFADAGLRDVLVLERSPEAGGLPLLCDHTGWGMLDLHRVYRGPRYAAELVRRASGVEIMTDHTVTALDPGGTIHVSAPSGPTEVASRAVLLTTGIREMPRGPRLVSGTRPWGVTTTGAFQDLVHSGLRPFRRPVIVGSELVAFSALVTARHAGIQPVAVIEQAKRITARRPGDFVARLLFGTRVLTGTDLVAIHGVDRVEGVTVDAAGCRETLGCDGVIFTGRFVPEAFLARSGGIAIDPGTGGPSIDNLFRCSDPHYSAAGNVLRPVEHSGVAAREGACAAASILRALRDGLPPPEDAVPVMAGRRLRYVYPQRVLADIPGPIDLVARARERHVGRLRVVADGDVVAERRVRVLPERRLTMRVPAGRLKGCKAVLVELE